MFDLDGVLVDSEGLWDEVRRGIAEGAGRAWPAGASAALQGVGTADWSNYLIREVGIPGTAESIANDVIDALARRYAEYLPLLPGALEAVDRLARKWPLGLASGSPRLLIDTVLRSSPLRASFRVAVASDEVAANKPAPDVYLEVVRRLGADPAQTVAIEDSANGMRSAHAAGLRLVVVPQPAFPQPNDALALADVVLDNLDDLTVDLVDAVLEGS